MDSGSSCDSLDVIDRYIALPGPEIGGSSLYYQSGTYTVSYASEFNLIIPCSLLQGYCAVPPP
jgi:diaminopimelate decarboxylase